MSQRFNEDVYKEEWQWQEGEYTVTRTTHWSAPGCHNGCGILAYTKDGKLVKVEGDPRAKYNRGRLCMKCLNMVENVNHPDRLKWPLLRDGEKGENKWKRISWDEAYEWIEKHYRQICEQYGPEYISVLVGTGRNCMWQPAMIGRVCFGTPNIGAGFQAGDACYQPRCNAQLVKCGDVTIMDASQMHPERENNPEWRIPEVIIIWGNEPLASNADGFYGHWIVDCMRLGSKLIVIDPALTWLAAKADIWLRMRPGTDAAIAMGMMRIILKEDLYDHEFVEKWCYGFEKLEEWVEEYTPEKVAEIAWLDKDLFIKATRMYANAKPGAIQWGVALDQQISAVDAAMIITDMMAITGNLDVPGGNIFVRYAYNSSKKYAFGVEALAPGMLDKRYGLDFSPMHATGYSNIANTDKLFHALETGEPYPIKMLWVHGTNPISCMGTDATRVYRAFKKANALMVVVDVFMTATAIAFADLVLPAAMSVERDSFRSWFQPLRTITKCTDDYYECKSDETIAFELAKRLNPGYVAKYSNVKEMLSDFIYEDGQGVHYSYEELQHKVNDWWEWDYTYKKYEKGLLRADGKPGFVTPTGLYEVTPVLFDIWGFPEPKHYEPPESPYSQPELFKEYPFVFSSGNRGFATFHSEYRQMPSMREFQPQPLMFINPEAAAELGLVEGDWAWIENMRGKCKLKVKFNKGLDKRVIQAQHGWWFPEREGAYPTLFGTFDSNPNNLTTQGEVGPTTYGAPVKCTICKVYKVTPENDESVTPNVVKGGHTYVSK
ncbi:MAG: molybdopterin-dependent oxidoreductase [Thermoanaerobacteraceae bacterium]|nr:molybdopterin-dependent oxidoreductase [Thermoanaerobacteraceae bacterium]